MSKFAWVLVLLSLLVPAAAAAKVAAPKHGATGAEPRDKAHQGRNSSPAAAPRKSGTGVAAERRTRAPRKTARARASGPRTKPPRLATAAVSQPAAPPATATPAPVPPVPASLVVATVERPPFTFFNEDTKVTGFSADLWLEIARRNNWPFTWRREESFPKVIAAVKDRTADAAIANISITSEREQFIDFSQPIYDSGLQIVAPAKDRGLGIFRLIWRSGALQLIGLAIVVLLVIAHVLWFFERNIADRRHDYFRDDYQGGVWDAFWWAFIIMTMGGFENEVPHRYWSRLLAMVWIVISLFFVSTLTAKITTSLTVDQLTSDINSYHDLLGKRVGVGENSTMARFLDQQNIPYRRYQDFKAALAALEVGQIDATIGDAPVTHYYVAHAGAGRVLLAGSVFNPDKLGIALPQGSRLREPLDRTLLAIREDGTYDALSRKWFGTAE